MSDETQELRRLIAELSERVRRLEQRSAYGPPVQDLQPTTDAPPPPMPIPASPPPQQVSGPGTRSAVDASRSETLESRIGSQWFNRIGIVAVLVGIALALKYVFENNWVGPGIRVALGLIGGLAIASWSERFRGRGYLVFSWSLKAIGAGTLYLTLWAGVQIYHLFSPATAFTAMVVVTASIATLSLAQEAQVLAAFAMVGGFATPVLLSTGEDHELFLFSYVALLDIATVLLISRRAWTRLLLGAYFGTTILYVGWYYQFYSRRLLPPTLGFATLFFAIFLLAPLFAAGGDNAGDRRLQRTLPALAVLNGAVYFLQLYSLLEAVDRWELAWAAVAVAAVYLALGRVQRVWNSNAVQGLDSVHFMLAVAFVTLAIPFGFAGHWITFGWLVEAAILLWILHRVGSRLQRNLAGAVLILAILRLLLYDNLPVSVPIFNARFGLYLAAIATLALGGTLARRQRLQFPVRGDLDRVEQLIPAVAMVLLNVLALIALNLEVHDYFRRSAETVLHARVSALPGVEARQLLIARDFAYSAVCMVYGAVLMWAGFAKRSAFLRWQALVLMAVTIAKVFTYDVSELDHGYRIASFVALGGLLLAVSFLYQRDWLQLSGRRKA